MATELRPLKIGEILDRGFKVFFRNLRPLVILSAITVIPVAIIGLLIQIALIPDSAVLTDDGQILVFSDADETRVNLSTAISGLIGFVGGLVTLASLHHAIADGYVEHAPDWRSSLRAALRRIGPVLLATIAIIILIAAPIIVVVVSGAAVLALLVVPLAIYLMIATSFAIPALMRERIGGLAAVSRSFRLVAGRWWRSFAVLVVAGIILFVLTVILAGIFGTGIRESTSSVRTAVSLSAILNTVVYVLLLPLFVSFVTVLYFDHRVRGEGFDLEQLVHESGIGEGSDATTSLGPDVDAPAGPTDAR